jgi:hypothetical protein
MIGQSWIGPVRGKVEDLMGCCRFPGFVIFSYLIGDTRPFSITQESEAYDPLLLMLTVHDNSCL